MDLIFLSTNKFNLSIIAPIQNNPGFNKPYGGLWLCDILNEKHSEWELFARLNMDVSFSEKTLISLNDNAKIISARDLYKYSNANSFDEMKICFTTVDFEAVSRDYDILEYKEGYSLGFFYGWDVNCYLVLNKDIIDEYRVIK